MKINLIEYFEHTLMQVPNKTAIIDKDRTITFEELAKKSKLLAQLIIKKRVIKNPIAVFLDKSIESIYADIAITYSGNFYMNLDIKLPTERIKNIITRVEPTIIISSTKLFPLIEPLVTNQIVIKVDEIDFSEKMDEAAIKQALSKIIDTDPLCIINTSGSTGTPKGVVLNHKNYTDYVNWGINRFSLTEDEILGVMSPIIFDHYNFEISFMMFKGATLVLLDNNLAAFPQKILDDVIKHNVTFIFWVPTIMVNIANMNLLQHNNLHKIRYVWFAGEVFPTKQFNIWRKHLPQATFVNLYGPIETTVDCTYYEVIRKLKDDEPIPIGYPCKNTDILILDDNNKLVTQFNTEGELCVRGTSLAMGYYNNPEQTAKAFVQNPLNKAYPETIYRTGDVVYYNEQNEIVFKGRRDTLIKHLGYRIELAEIEHVIINTLKLVPNGCVVYNKNDKEIILFYENTSEITAAEFRKSIGSNLPKYMIPVKYIYLEKMPMNTNGKIDRLYLNNQVNNG